MKDITLASSSILEVKKELDLSLRGGETSTSGIGVLIDKSKKLILTDAKTVKPWVKGELYIKIGTYKFPAKIFFIDEKLNIALLQLEKIHNSMRRVEFVSHYPKSREVYVIGRDEKMLPKAERAIITGKGISGKVFQRGVYKLNKLYNKFQNGSLILNSTGKLIGLLDDNAFLDSNYIQFLLPNAKRSLSAFLSASFRIITVDKEISKSVNIKTGSTALAVRSILYENADDDKLLPGDIILSVNGITIKDSLCALQSSLKTPISIFKVLRKEEKQYKIKRLKLRVKNSNNIVNNYINYNGLIISEKLTDWGALLFSPLSIKEVNRVKESITIRENDGDSVFSIFKDDEDDEDDEYEVKSEEVREKVSVKYNEEKLIYIVNMDIKEDFAREFSSFLQHPKKRCIIGVHSINGMKIDSLKKLKTVLEKYSAQEVSITVIVPAMQILKEKNYYPMRYLLHEVKITLPKSKVNIAHLSN